MTGTRAISAPSPVRALRRILIVSLAVGAVLIGLLALHSVAGSHGGVSVAAAGSVQLTHLDQTSMTDAAYVSSAPSESALLLFECDQNCERGCALVAMACLILVVLAAMVFLARDPALFYRLRDRGRRLIELIPEARNHVYLPSLTVLSISRT